MAQGHLIQPSRREKSNRATPPRGVAHLFSWSCGHDHRKNGTHPNMRAKPLTARHLRDHFPGLLRGEASYPLLRPAHGPKRSTSSAQNGCELRLNLSGGVNSAVIRRVILTPLNTGRRASPAALLLVSQSRPTSLRRSRCRSAARSSSSPMAFSGSTTRSRTVPRRPDRPSSGGPSSTRCRMSASMRSLRPRPWRGRRRSAPCRQRPGRVAVAARRRRRMPAAWSISRSRRVSSSRRRRTWTRTR